MLRTEAVSAMRQPATGKDGRRASKFVRGLLTFFVLAMLLAAVSLPSMAQTQPSPAAAQPAATTTASARRGKRTGSGHDSGSGRALRPNPSGSESL